MTAMLGRWRRKTEETPAEAVVERAWHAARERLGDLGVPLRRYRSKVSEVLAEHPDLGGDPQRLALEDLYLALACQRGDERAWHLVHQSFGPYLRSVGFRAMGGRSVDEIEEVEGQLYASLLPQGEHPGKLERYSGLAGLGTWLAAILRRMALDTLRSEQRRRRRELRASPADHEQAAAPDPEQDFLQAERRHKGAELLRAALLALSPQQRLVLRLVYWDELNLREAGTILGVDFSTVSRRLRSAREELLGQLHRAARRNGLGEDEIEELLRGEVAGILLGPDGPRGAEA